MISIPALVGSDKPRTIHSIVQIPIAEGALGASLPFLFTENGCLSILALAWARSKMLEEGASSATLRDGVSALGRFLDYYRLVYGGGELRSKELLLLLKKFYEARRFGCDSLGWQAVRSSTASNDVRLVSEFSDWAAENFSITPMNAPEQKLIQDLTLSEQQRLTQIVANKKRWDFFAHLSATTKLGGGQLSKRPFSPKTGRTRASRVRHFPPEKIHPLIAATPSVRDKLFFLLLFYGGLRISEPLHIFVRDVSIRPDGTAKVILAHPQDGKYQWIDAAQQRRSGKRIDYLAQRYGISPRNLLSENHPLHSGWKGMLEDDPARRQSEVHWLDADMSRLFAHYHAIYIEGSRRSMRDVHPYYFSNQCSSKHFGTPLKMSNIVKAFYRAAVRVGLTATSDGVNPHGARHFFGYYCASVLRLSLEVTQRLMHHEESSSTEIYYSLSDEVVRNELSRAQKSTRPQKKSRVLELRGTQ